MFTLLAFTETRRSSVRDTFIALVMNSLWDWEPRERLNSIEDFFSFRMTSTIVNATKAWTQESGRPERIEVL